MCERKPAAITSTITHIGWLKIADNPQRSTGPIAAALSVPCHPVDGFGTGYSLDHGGFIEVVFARVEWSALGFFGSEPGTQAPVTPFVALRFPVTLAKVLAENLSANVKRIEDGRDDALSPTSPLQEPSP